MKKQLAVENLSPEQAARILEKLKDRVEDWKYLEDQERRRREQKAEQKFELIKKSVISLPEKQIRRMVKELREELQMRAKRNGL